MYPRQMLAVFQTLVVSILLKMDNLPSQIIPAFDNIKTSDQLFSIIMATLFPIFLVVLAVIFRHMTNATGITNFITGTRAIFSKLPAATNKLYALMSIMASRLIRFLCEFGPQLFLVTYSAMLVPYVQEFPLQLIQSCLHSIFAASLHPRIDVLLRLAATAYILLCHGAWLTITNLSLRNSRLFAEKPHGVLVLAACAMVGTLDYFIVSPETGNDFVKELVRQHRLRTSALLVCDMLYSFTAKN